MLSKRNLVILIFMITLLGIDGWLFQANRRLTDSNKVLAGELEASKDREKVNMTAYAEKQSRLEKENRDYAEQQKKLKTMAKDACDSAPLSDGVYNLLQQSLQRSSN